jgi:predicted nucleic acid-binding protein
MALADELRAPLITADRRLAEEAGHGGVILPADLVG